MYIPNFANILKAYVFHWSFVQRRSEYSLCMTAHLTLDDAASQEFKSWNHTCMHRYDLLYPVNFYASCRIADMMTSLILKGTSSSILRRWCSAQLRTSHMMKQAKLAGA